jgi:hypothetical protein
MTVVSWSMTLHNFRQLDFNAQTEATLGGVLISQRQSGSLKINLYAVSNFYVEIYYCPFEDRIKRFRPFKSTNALGPYLRNISVEV